MAIEVPANRVSSYLEHLPAIFQQDADEQGVNFIGRFLLAFEMILSGLGDPDHPGLEEIIDRLHTYFDPGGGKPLGDPNQAPAQFLEWLASWVALTLRADLDERRRRDFIARAVPLYRLRGTKQGLEEYVSIYTRLAATINEMNTPFQIGAHSTIGVDTLLDGGGPHFFRVLIRLPTPDPGQVRYHREVVTAIVDMEKPAHTYYALDVETPTLQIGDHSTVGVDTLLGPSPG